MKRTHLIAVMGGVVAMGIFAAEASGMYNAGIGCFMQRDPSVGGLMGAPRVGAAGPAVGARFVPRDQNPDGMNLYQYVRNNPVNYGDRYGLWALSVHQDLAKSAAHPVFGDNKDFMKCIGDASSYPDVPDGHYTLNTGGFWLDVKSGFDPELAGRNNGAEMTYRSHFGDLQYWHGMAAPGKDAEEMVKLIENWVGGQCDKAAKECGCKQANEIGPALHTLQDLYCLSHTQRDWANGGAIIRFQDYGQQDSSKHVAADDIAMSESGLKRQGYNKALAATFMMLKYLKNGKCEEARTWVRNTVLNLAKGAQSGGTDPQFAK